MEYLNKVLSFQTEIIQNNGGDVDKYVGDEIVAIFSGSEKEINACKSALDIQKEMAVNSSVLYDGLSVGIGINTGEVILGMIGSESRADFTVSQPYKIKVKGKEQYQRVYILESYEGDN
ncbi:MAG: adenylate/guanylate cyclase domain-containing protein [Spirochaetales bacterium]|nr:adenylate/guanylate cyclase domain-containing protein [Spirochaetales bacterium]